MPFSLRVTSSAVNSSSSTICQPRAASSALLPHGPTTASNSPWFGVSKVAPRYLSKSRPFGSTSTGTCALRHNSIMRRTSVSAPLP